MKKALMLFFIMQLCFILGIVFAVSEAPLYCYMITGGLIGYVSRIIGMRIK